MLWLNTHARTRRRLSPYIDGHLLPRERASLEAHLTRCDACRSEVEELRATISTIGALTDVEPPRSFALTPQMLERRSTMPPASTPPLANGMRLAGAGVAFVLAVVLIGDFASMSGGGSGSDDGGMGQEAEIQMNDLDNRDAAAPYAAPAATGAAEGDAFVGEDRAAPEELSSSADKTEPCAPAAGSDTQSAGGAGGPVTESQEATPTLEPAPVASPSPPLEAGSAAVGCAPAVADMLAQEEETSAGVEAVPSIDEGEFAAAPAPEAVANDDSGVSTLTVLEVVLAGGFAALMAAIGIEYVLRRRTI